jgi:NADH-quinone oxidoreductase subunit L
MYPLNEHSSISTLLMIVGAVTILLAVAMALVQKDFKRLLSYHAISQVGYMILGIGTATAFGVIGGLFHMINNALYKSLLFCTGGAVEHRTGTTDLAKLGGLGAKMPITCGCFVIAALSISGFPLTNGFFSKELVYAGALERNVIFYAAALLGSFLTAASFLKLGHAAFFGKRNPEHDTVREAPASMLLPMVLLAAGCLAFAYNPLPINRILLPAVEETRVARGPAPTDAMPAGNVPTVQAVEQAEEVPHYEFGAKPMSGWPTDVPLILGTVIVLAAAVINHIVGVKRTGKGLGAVDHIHYAPVLHTTYNLADRRAFDPYEWLLKLVAVISAIGFALDRIIDWIQDGLASGLARALSALVRAANTGSYAAHILWAIIGAAAIVYFLATSAA